MELQITDYQSFKSEVLDNHHVLEQLLRERDETKLTALWRLADETRRLYVGEDVHLRGLVEISNHCSRQCHYCGLRSPNSSVTRYRMSVEEVTECALKAAFLGYGTVVLQAGEDPGLSPDIISDIVRRIKKDTSLAVTLSLGERDREELIEWRRAGADRYLLRFETSNSNLFKAIHPHKTSQTLSRLDILNVLKTLGYEVGSGVMVGIPGQRYEDLVNDLALFRELDLDMIGIGPYIPHPMTPLGKVLSSEDDIPADALTAYKMTALTRLVRPDSNIPCTTAIRTINRADGLELGLQRGANVAMPNLTPIKYRALYDIYPGKACQDESAEICHPCITRRIESTGRKIGKGQGSRSQHKAVR